MGESGVSTGCVTVMHALSPSLLHTSKIQHPRLQFLQVGVREHTCVAQPVQL
jgi:hypothetical protein